MDGAGAEQVRRSQCRSLGQLVRRLVAAIRDNDEDRVEAAVLQLARTRRIFAPLALAVGAFVMLFNGLRLLVTNWRLMLVQALPAMWIWAATVDLKAHVLRGREFAFIRGPVVLVLFAAVVLITIAAFYLNAAFAFAISQPGPPDLRAGFGQARQHIRAVTGWGASIGLALAVATMLAPRWGLGWFAFLLGVVLAVMMVCYVAVPARIIGVRTGTPAGTAGSGRAAKLAGVAVTGPVQRRSVHAAVCHRQTRPAQPSYSGLTGQLTSCHQAWARSCDSDGHGLTPLPRSGPRGAPAASRLGR